MKSLAKIYKENYKHKHTLKYIREVIETSLGSNFGFEISSVNKSFQPVSNSNRILDDFYLSNADLLDIEESEGKLLPSYTVFIRRKDDLYTDYNLDGYIYLLKCLKDAEDEFSKRNMRISLNTIEAEMDFDVVEIDSAFSVALDNKYVGDFITSCLLPSYIAKNYRNYSIVTDDKLFHRLLIEDKFDDVDEANDEANIRHFKEFLELQCAKNGFKYIELGKNKFDICTKRQHRMFTIKEILK